MIGAFNNLMRYRYSHVLLYHASFAEPPAEIKDGLHNVTPEVIRQQLTWLKKKFTPVTVDELAANPRSACFAVTFDDAYKCVFEEALPVFEELQVPFTVYVNSSTLEKKIFWRDKVRQLMNSGRVDDFLHFAQRKNELASLTKENFYRQSKNPQINSHLVHEMLNDFLGESSEGDAWCVDSADTLIDHPLIAYGNHTRNHYVLSSLSDSEQADEILSCEHLLKEQKLKLSQYLSIPFGGAKDFNPATVRIAREAGFAGLLYSRNRLERGLSRGPDNFPAMERFMVPASLKAFQKHLMRMTINDFRGRWK